MDTDSDSDSVGSLWDELDAIQRDMEEIHALHEEIHERMIHLQEMWRREAEAEEAEEAEETEEAEEAEEDIGWLEQLHAEQMEHLRERTLTEFLHRVWMTMEQRVLA